ncbi:MAG: hypothetical protein EOO01_33415, partial [Chitinophagaceae bacterium]
MSHTEQIIRVITDFVKGGDYSDVSMLDRVLHPEFTVMSYNYMGAPGIKVINKQEYLLNVANGVFGGLPRKIRIEAIDISGSLAMVRLRLESAENNFISQIHETNEVKDRIGSGDAFMAGLI